MVADGREHQAKTAPNATSGMAAASAMLLIVFQLGQTHRIGLMRAILVPWGAKCNTLYFNKLQGII